MQLRRLMVLIGLYCFALFPQAVSAQCSICTRSAQQMGERPAKALNAGIIYLAIAPLAIFGVIGYRWWRNNSQP